MSMERRLFLVCKRVEVFGRVLFALRKLPNVDAPSYRQLWQRIGLETERFYSSR
jgi:hypothetical protein